MSSNASDDNRTRIATSLRFILEEGGTGNFVIFELDKAKNYYVQCAGERDNSTLRCEAVGNRVLKPSFLLTTNQVTQLASMGWTAPTQDNPNFYREWKAGNDSDQLRIADEVMRALEIYGLPSDRRFDIELSLE